MPPSKLLIVSSRARKANAAAGSLMPGIALIRYRLFFSFLKVWNNHDKNSFKAMNQRVLRICINSFMKKYNNTRQKLIIYLLFYLEVKRYIYLIYLMVMVCK